MSLILKSKLGNITSRFKRNDLPTKKEIESMTDAERELASKSLDTVITDLRSQYESAKAGRPVEDKVISAMLNSRLKPVSLEEIDSRIKQLEEINQEFFSSVDPLHGQEKFGIKFDIPIEGKTNKEWTIETLTQLYNEMGSNPSVELLYALHYFINEKTGGQFTSGKGQWITTAGREISKDNPEPLKEIFKLRLDPDVTNNVDRKVFNYFTDKYKYTVTGIQNIDEEVNRPRERTVLKPGEKPSKQSFMETKTIRRRTTGKMIMGEKGSIQILLAPNVADKVNRITLTDLRELITNLNKVDAGKDFISSLEGPSIDIVYEIINAKGIDNLTKEIQVSRKGESGQKKRREFLTNWALKYIEEKRREDPSRQITIGNTDIQSIDEMKPILSKTIGRRTPEEQREINSYQKNKNTIISFLKRQIEEDRKTFVDSYKSFISQSRQIETKLDDLSEEEMQGLNATQRREYIKNYLEDTGSSNVTYMDLKYYIDTDYSELNYILKQTNLRRFSQNIFSLLVNAYISSDEEDYDKVRDELITVSNTFRQYIPTGKLFKDNSKDTFLDSMRALLTIFKRLLGREEISKYNNTFDELTEELRDALNEFYEEAAEEAEDEGLTEEDRLEVLEFAITEGILEDEIETILGKVSSKLEELRETINEMLADLADNMTSLIISNIQEIGDDTTGKYKEQGLKVKGRSEGIREYLISKKYLQQPTPPFTILQGEKKYVIDEDSKKVKDLYTEIIYYEEQKMGNEVFINKKNEFRTTLSKILDE